MGKQLRDWVRTLNWRYTSRRYYYSIVRRMILVICITSLVAGAITARVLVGNEVAKAGAANEAELRIAAAGVDEALYTLERESFLLSQSAALRSLLPMGDFSQDLGVSVAFSNSLMQCKNNNDSIEEIYFYSRNMAGIFSNRYGYVDSPNELYANIDYLTGQERPSGWAELPHMNTDEHLAFFRKVPMLKSGDPEGVLVFYIKKKPLQTQLIRNPGFYHNVSFVLDSEGGVILSKDAAARGEEELAQLLEAGLLGEDTELDTVRQTVVTAGGRQYLVAQVTTGYGRTYLSALEKAGLLYNVGVVLVTIAAILAVTIGVGIVFAVRYSRQIYSPVEALVARGREKGVVPGGRKHEMEYLRECFDALCDEAESVNRYAAEIRGKLREDTLGRLLREALPGDGVGAEECESLGIPRGCQYGVVVLSSAHEPLRMEELRAALPHSHPHDLAPCGQYHAALICYLDRRLPRESARRSCAAYAEAVAARYGERCGQELRTGVGDACGELRDLCAGYRDAVLRAGGGVEPAGSGEAAPHLDLSRVHGCARTLLAHLERDAQSQAVHELDRFVGEAAGHSDSHAVRMLELLLTDLLFLADSKAGVDMAQLLPPVGLMRTAGGLRDRLAHTVFPRLGSRFGEMRLENGIAPRACRYIQEHVFDDITLGSCAEHVGVTPAYLSKLFKRDMEVNFLDYVLSCKIEQAKRMLKDTDMSVSEIADKVRYSPRSLYRHFYKHTLLSPNEFRKAQAE